MLLDWGPRDVVLRIRGACHRELYEEQGALAPFSQPVTYCLLTYCRQRVLTHAPCFFVYQLLQSGRLKPTAAAAAAYTPSIALRAGLITWSTTPYSSASCASKYLFLEKSCATFSNGCPVALARIVSM